MDSSEAAGGLLQNPAERKRMSVGRMRSPRWSTSRRWKKKHGAITTAVGA